MISVIKINIKSFIFILIAYFTKILKMSIITKFVKSLFLLQKM